MHQRPQTMQGSAQLLLLHIFCFVRVCQMFPAGNEEAASQLGYPEDNKSHEAEFIISGKNISVISNALKDFQKYPGIKQTGSKEEVSLGDNKFANLPSGTRDVPDLCQDASIDTVTQTQNGSTFVFKGDFYWKIQPDGIANGYPQRISDDWGGLEGNLDASLTWSNGNIYFFKGERYWRFKNNEIDNGYPKLLDIGFEGIPKSPDAAFEWRGNGKTYFFKGDQYWKYDGNSDPPVSSEYPKPISNWNGLPNNIDAALQWRNNKTYFFKADKYYRFNDITFQADSRSPPYPRATSVWWFKCQAISQNLSTTATSMKDSENIGPEEVTPNDNEVTSVLSNTSDVQDLCRQNATIDTVTRTQNGSTYVFKGDFYWKIQQDGIADGYPRKISDDWRGLEGNLDASLTWSNGKTYFFKGGRYWRFKNNEMDKGYPKPIAIGFPGIPESPDAAFEWSGNGKTYFFKGDQYWKFDGNKDPPVSSKYPKPISYWNGLPNNIDAAFQWKNNKTYFFKADKYYRFNDLSFQVDSRSPPYPRANSFWWFKCQAISQNSSTTATSTEDSENTGPKEEVPSEDNKFTSAPPDTNDPQDLCRQDASIDTITRTQNGSTYVFKGNFYWKIVQNAIADGYPRRISDDWCGLEGNLDASLTGSNGKTYFFKGGRYWRFKNYEMDKGYPKSIAIGFQGIPESPDAAFEWSGNGKTYFFKGDQYWKFNGNNDPPVSSKYPKPISYWNGLPNNIDAAFQWKNNKTYFFKADKYYRFNDASFQVESRNPPYPRETSVWWFNCQAITQNSSTTATLTEASENMGYT